VPPDPDHYGAIARGLGADVPACLLGVPARLAGIGERLTPFDAFPALPLLLVNPGGALATAAVFAERRPAETSGDRLRLPACLDLAGLTEHLRGSGNDLEPAACRLRPEIAQVLDRLRRHPDCLLARMSGSGATCFGLFPDAAAAERANLELRREQPGWWVAATCTGGMP
jgi:4-diphosphocytidyl-2-C-methyl-D-erythritol kinase